jgi:hypothetical protein
MRRGLLMRQLLDPVRVASTDWWRQHWPGRGFIKCINSIACKFEKHEMVRTPAGQMGDVSMQALFMHAAVVQGSMQYVKMLLMQHPAAQLIAL